MKKKKVFILSLALSVMTIGGTVCASSLIKSEDVTIYFNAAYVGTLVSGAASTGTLNTNAASYLEEHYGIDTSFYSSTFCAKLVSVTPWFQPNITKDISYSVGTFSNKGWNRGSFAANETLRTNMSANGYGGYSMRERSNTYQE